MAQAQARRRAQSVPARVGVVGSEYRVVLGDEIHFVKKDKTCSCGRDCIAIGAVKQYLRTGGQRAPVPLAQPEPAAQDDEEKRPPVWDRLQARWAANQAQDALRSATCHICGAPTAAPQGVPMRHDHYICSVDPSHYFEWRLRKHAASPEQVAAAREQVAECAEMQRQLMDWNTEAYIGGRWIRWTVFC